MDNLTKLAKAKTALVLEHPFVGTIALQKLTFHIESEEWFKARGLPASAAVSSTSAYFCDEFIDELNDDEMKFLVAHECFHPMLEHNWRRQERDPAKWNQAADYVINKLLHDERIGKMPECGLYSEQIYKQGGGTSEGIYATMPEQPDGGKGGGSGNGGGSGQQQMDSIIDAEGTPAEKEQESQEWRVAVAQAAQAAKMMGKLSAGMERLVDEILNPEVPWEEVLYRFIEKHRDDRRTFARPNRRLISQGIYLPSPDGESMGEIAFAIDCSGSISQEELNQYAAEIKAVKEELRPARLHVLYFDSSVCHVDVFERDDELQVAMHGGGGTAFSPVFKWMQENQVDPLACIFLTDLYCSDFGDDPGYPVLWVSTSDQDKVPFGEVVKFN